jgi:hypothetical protein
MLNFDWLSGIPLPVAKWFVLLAFFGPLLFAFSLPRKYIYQGAQDQAPWRNLKVWVLLLVGAQVAVYLYF